MTLLVLRRDASRPPLERERLVIEDDGSATAWRSTGTIVGLLRGQARDAEGLRRAADGVRDVGPPVLDAAPDASVETLEAAGRTARVEARMTVPGPWGTLASVAREELQALATPDSAVAAVSGVLGVDGRVRLEHRGTEPLRLELSGIGVELVLWRGGRDVARGSTWGRGPGEVEAGPGWSLEVEAPVIDLAGGGDLVAVVGFGARDGDAGFVPVTLTLDATLP